MIGTSLIVLGVVVTGIVDTLVFKYMDKTCAIGVDYYEKGQTAHENPCPDRMHGSHQFDHPFIQSALLYVCYVLLYLLIIGISWITGGERVRGARLPIPPSMFLPLAFCDMIGLIMMTISLDLTYVSLYQMLRGSIVIFAGLLTRFVLKRRLPVVKWAGIAIVFLGMACIGLAAKFSKHSSENAPQPFLGAMLALFSQVFIASAIVFEEYIMKKHPDINLWQFTGFEGLYATPIIAGICLVGWWIPGEEAGGKHANLNDAFAQISHSSRLRWTVAISFLSISSHKVVGLVFIKRFSAASRAVIDQVRNIFIWIYSLTVGWEQFSWLELSGFLLVLLGNAVYYEFIVRAGDKQTYNKLSNADDRPMHRNESLVIN
eukprot:TRINITY_DN12252_c0_g1_i1.p2 TRINITY_DN12252_c0_g1~~TRINITY_DN12252_c0_g1_i1.p2  ORF type:complete len:374 (+),score=61.32 TRINITY_DN12252_c0_g1_i1:3316-4437(+)